MIDNQSEIKFLELLYCNIRNSIIKLCVMYLSQFPIDLHNDLNPRVIKHIETKLYNLRQES